jgi:predicted nucleic acid-binding protein
MIRKRISAFLDTSVVIAAVFSSAGGARKLFLLSEAGAIDLFVGPRVLEECDAVIRRKKPSALALLAQLLATALISTAEAPDQNTLEALQPLVPYAPDAHVLAEAIQAGVEWFATHDKDHFLKNKKLQSLSLKIGTPGDVLLDFKDHQRQD